MTVKEQAVLHHANGCNCCQSVLCALGGAVCDKCIAFAAETAEQLISEQKK